MGDEIAGTQHTLEVRVQAASWVDCDRVLVYVDGSLVETIPVPDTREVLRLEATRELEFTHDSWVVVVAEGDDALRPIVLDQGRAVRPIAIANPIWVDADGDEEWIGGGGEHAQLLVETDAQRLRDALGSEQRETRLAALRAIERQPRAELRGELEQRLSACGSNYERIALLRALESVDPGSLPRRLVTAELSTARESDLSELEPLLPGRRELASRLLGGLPRPVWIESPDEREILVGLGYEGSSNPLALVEAFSLQPGWNELLLNYAQESLSEGDHELWIFDEEVVCAQLEPTPPNVLLMIADDLGWADLSCAGLVDDVETPNLDRLAARGVRFTQAYASSPICNASRASLMTGSYQQRQGIYWYGGPGIHDVGYPTIAELLRPAGYSTGYVGKFHYGGGRVHQPGSRSFPLDHGYDEFYGFSGGRKHYLVHEAASEQAFREVKRAHRRQGQSLEQGGVWIGREKVDQHGFSTELLGERARDFLRAHAEERFFLTLSFNAVHNFTHQLPPEYMAEHGLEGYHDWDPATEDYTEWYRAGRAPNNPEGRAHYLGQLHYLDREVGRVLDLLDELELSRDTIVVFIGDNGGSTPIYADNGPLRGSKYTLYEGGVRVPLIVSWPPQYRNGEVSDAVVSAMDLLPTLVSAAGIELPAHVDGQDLGSMLRSGFHRVEHHTLHWDTNHESAVRWRHWKLKTARSDAHAQHEMVELELGTFLYNLERDPGESTDVSAENPALVERLTELHAAWRAGLND